MNESITKAMTAIQQASAALGEGHWDTQRHLLAAYDQLAEARRTLLAAEISMQVVARPEARAS